MKNLFVFLFLMFINQVYAQKYQPLVQEGKYWIYNQYSHSSCFLMGWNSTEVRYFNGDTLINSKSYKKLISSLATSQRPPYEISSRKTICYMREDTLLKKVFMVNLDEDVFPCVNSSNELLIWNFGMKVGDTLPDCLINIFNPVDFGDEKSFVLDSINIFPIYSGQILKHFYYLGVQPGICGDLSQMPVKFIEGFGMEDGPIFKRYGTFLVAYCEGTLEQCNIISSTTEGFSDIQNMIMVSPNPAMDFISFHLDDDIRMVVNQYCIRNMSGQLIKDIRPVTTDKNYVIHTQDFPSGIYIIQFLKDGIIVHSEKVVVSH